MTTADRPAVTRFHLNKHSLQLPIQLDDKYRPQLLEIHLYCKETPSAPWTLRQKVPATQTFFAFQAPQDGEYWFTMATVDRQGRCVPADITREEPAICVVVDSQPPQVDLMLLGSVPEGQLVQCDVRDAFPDPRQTRLQYQTADKVFRDLDPLPDRPNVFCIPAQANITGQIRVCAADLAGNLASRECTIGQLPSLGNTAANLAAVPPVIARVSAEQKLIGPQLMPEKSGSPSSVEQTPCLGKPPATITMPPAEKTSAPGLLPGSLGAGPGLAASPGTAPQAIVSQGPPLSSVVGSRQAAPVSLANEASKMSVQQTGARLVQPGASQPGETSNTAAVPAVLPPASRHEATPVRYLLVNSTRLFLEYRIEQAGPSGVGRVEIWCTRDKGQTWQKLAEDQSRRSPAEVHLSGEGLYGLTLVVTNGMGFGAQPPGPGDPADWWIEVDSTPPTAQITTVRLAPEVGPTVHIGWTSQDANLGSSPAEISYAVNRQGPWLSIARGLKGEGEFRWVPPPDIGPQAYIRLTVRDTAGNTTITETTQPIALDDLSRPRARIAGISTDAAVPPTQGPGGN
jgi:hypothetical protein